MAYGTPDPPECECAICGAWFNPADNNELCPDCLEELKTDTLTEFLGIGTRDEQEPRQEP